MNFESCVSILSQFDLLIDRSTSNKTIMIMEETKEIKTHGQMIKTNFTIEHNSAIFSANYKKEYFQL